MPQQKRGLGKGLGALIPSASPAVAAEAVRPPEHPPPQRHSPLRSRPWRTLHSLWLLPALLGLGFWTWLSFLYLGMRARRRNWLLTAVAYAALLVGACTLGETDNSQWANELFACWILALWGGGTIHALVVNRSWLRWRSDHTPWYLS